MLKIGRYSRSYLVAVPVSLCVFLSPLLDSLGMFQATDAGVQIVQWVRGFLLVLMLANIALHSGRSGRHSVHRIILPLIWLPLYAFILFAVRDTPLVLNIGYVLRYFFLVAIFYNVILSVRTGAISERWLQYAAWCALSLAVAGQIGGMWFGRSFNGGYESALSGLTIGPGIIAAGLLSLLPAFLYLSERPGLGYLGLTLCTLALIATFRRSGILAAGLGLAIYLVLWSARANAKRLRPVLLALGSVAVLAGVFSATPVARGLIARFEDLNISRGGTGSGRTQIWTIVLDHIERREFGQQLFGEGPLAILALTREKFLNGNVGIGAHNDWLDVLMGLGLVGASLQIWFFANVFTLARRLLRVNPQMGIACFSTFGMMVFLGATTGGVFDPTMAPMYALIGYAAFELQRCRRNSLLRRELTEYRILLNVVTEHTISSCGIGDIDHTASNMTTQDIKKPTSSPYYGSVPEKKCLKALL